MRLTYFKTKNPLSKIPFSPYEDLTFDFETIDVEVDELFRIMVSEFVLNIPLRKSLKRVRRLKSTLNPHCCEKLSYLIIDINNIRDKDSQIKILRYFKDYKCIFGESRSNNNIDNFNLRGILCIEPISIQNLKILADQLKSDLARLGDLDVSTAKIGSVSAPIRRYNVLLESNSKLYKYKYAPNTLKFMDIKVDSKKLTSLSDLCLQAFCSLGFRVTGKSEGCLFFTHSSHLFNEKFYWFENSPFVMHCQCDESRSVNIRSAITSLPESRKFLTHSVDYDLKLRGFDESIHTLKKDKKVLDIDNDIAKTVDRFLNSKDSLYAIRSPMGTGKGTIIKYIIKVAQEMDMRVLVCTNRVSLAHENAEKYNLKIYNDYNYVVNDSVVVQFDSLHMYDMCKFDLIIFDEFISLLLHSRNNITKVVKNVVNFYAALNKKVVIADAFLTGYESCFFKRWRETFLLDNMYRDDTSLYEYEDFNSFVRSVIITAKNNKVTVSSTSKKMLLAFKDALSATGKKVLVLTSDTPQALKETIYNGFKNNTSTYDALLYTPTLTVGVSNMNDVYYHFHYDCSSSCDVISSLQMIKRTRKAKEIHYYIKGRTQYLKTDYNDIKDEYMRNISSDACFLEYDDYGGLRLSLVGSNLVKVDVLRNILEVNHKDSFNYLLKYQFGGARNIVSYKFDANMLLPYIREGKKRDDAFMEECLEDYMDLIGLQGDKVNITECNVGVFNILSDLSAYIRKDTPDDVRYEILEYSLRHNEYLRKMLRYKVVMSFQNGTLSRDDIARIITSNIIGDADEVLYWNLFLGFESDLDREYPLKVVKSNSKLRRILEGCGYGVRVINGVKKYCVSAEVEKYVGYIRDDRFKS